MAKKAAEKNDNILTDAEIDKLASEVHGTCQNVYRLAERLFPGKVLRGNEDWDRLESIGGVFKCEECNEWKAVDCKEPDFEALCTSCVDNDGRDDDDL